MSNLTFEEMVGEVEYLTGAEKEEALKNMNPMWVKPKYERCFRKDSRLYGFHTSEVYGSRSDIELPDPVPLGAFVFQLDTAAMRLKGVVDDISRSHGPARFILVDGVGGIEKCAGFCRNVIELTGRPGFSRLAAMAAGVNFPWELAEKAGTSEFPVVCKDIQSQYFHELIHNFRENYIRDGEPLNDLSEGMPQLGEFLYDPANNPRRNEIFMINAHEIASHVRGGDGLDRYSETWATDAKLLLWEARQRDPGLAIPVSVDGQLEMLQKLPEIYTGVTQEERDAIMAKYFPLTVEEIEQTASSYAKDLRLKIEISPDEGRS